MPLSDKLNNEDTHKAIIADAMREVDAEVAGLRGIKGRAIGAGYAALKRLRPNMIEVNLAKMLRPMSVRLDPHFEAGQAAGDVPAYFTANADAIAEDLLAVTDDRVARSSNTAAVSIYNRLRKSARDNVVDAMPRIGAFCLRHGS